MAKGLTFRIIREGLSRGWWSRDSVLLDPFGGIGSTGLAASALGMRSLLVELEPRFVALSEANFAKHRPAWQRMGLPEPRIVQGDSRRLGEIVREAVGGSCTSPPWADGLSPTSGVDTAQRKATAERLGIRQEEVSPIDVAHPSQTEYGRTEGQIGRLPLGAVSSPPYANRLDDSGTGPVAEKNGRYGDTEGQMGNLRLSALTSPPFSSAENQPISGRTSFGQGTRQRLQDAGTTPDDRQMLTDGNIAALPIGGSVTSPPYEGIAMTGGDAGLKAHGTGLTGGERAFTAYGPSIENLGNAAPEDYWTACATVYQQLYDLFPPGGVLALVVKSFVRNKVLVPLPEMTLDLLLSQGWEPVLWVDAMLTGAGTQGSMLAEVPEKLSKRTSFFRRLYEKKYPGNEINAEQVLVVRKA